MEFIEGKTVTIEDNEYVGAFFNFTNNGDATTYCPNDNEMKIGFETSKLVNLQSKGIIYLLESKFVQTIVLQHCLDLTITVWNI